MSEKGHVRQLLYRAAAVLGILLMLTGLLASASEIQENQDKLDDIQDNIDRIEEERKATQDRLNELKNAQADVQAYIAAVDGEIQSVMNEVAVMTEEKFAVMQQIETTEKELAEAEMTAADQYAKMKLRIRYMYERGDTEYLELLLASEGLTDFLSRAEYISQISEYDRTMLTSYEKTVEEVNEAKETLLERKKELEEWETELAAREASLQLLADAKAEELEELEDQIDRTDQMIVDYDQALKEEEAELLEIQREIERLEEEERKRKEEEERKRREEEERRQQETSGGGSQGQDPGSDQTVSSMGMIWPVASCTRITSYFGHRVDPLTGEADGTLSDHKGIDIALAGGALAGAPVSAAAGGRVVIARTSTSAGNWIILYHGNSTYTVYMHLQSLNVSEGDTVSQGETIGLVGNTGWSTAAHLHFEVRVGGFVNSSYSVNPLDYVSP